MIDVSVIIVNYNTTQLTKQCIQSVFQYRSKYVLEVILIDNASADRSIEQLAAIFPEIKFIQNNRNIGFGAANNKGIKIAKGEFVFLLNSDTLLLSDAITAFVDYMRNPTNNKVAVCGGSLLSPNLEPATAFGNFPSILCAVSLLGFKFLYPKFYQQQLALGVVNYSPEIKVVDFISGANMFIRACVLKAVGLFDESFFLYFEETELSYRIWKAGYQSVLLPEINIIHYEGSSAVQSDLNSNQKELNTTQYRFYVTSRKLFYKKVCSKPKRIFLEVLDIASMLIKTLTQKEKGNLFFKLKMLLTAPAAE
jgi:GT2 family glycosyltransferase